MLGIMPLRLLKLRLRYCSLFSWDLSTQLIVWQMDPREESEVGDAGRYLAIELRRLEVQRSYTGWVTLAACNTEPIAELIGIILP